MGFTAGKGSEKGSQRGSEKGVSRRCLERPLGEYDPLGARALYKWSRGGDTYHRRANSKEEKNIGSLRHDNQKSRQ